MLIRTSIKLWHLRPLHACMLKIAEVHYLWYINENSIMVKINVKWLTSIFIIYFYIFLILSYKFNRLTISEIVYSLWKWLKDGWKINELYHFYKIIREMLRVNIFSIFCLFHLINQTLNLWILYKLMLNPTNLIVYEIYYTSFSQSSFNYLFLQI